MSDLRRASETLRAHLAQRAKLHAELDYQAETGIRAADFTPSDKPAPIDPPPRPDPTGEVGITQDRARQLRAELDQAEARILQAIRTLQRSPHPAPRLVQAPAAIAYIASVRSKEPTWHRARQSIDAACQTLFRIRVEVLEAKPPDAAHRKKLGVAEPPETWCSICGNEPPHTANPTTVAGNLPEPRWVGSTCYFRIRATGIAPSKRDLEHLKRTGRWPKIKEQAA